MTPVRPTVIASKKVLTTPSTASSGKVDAPKKTASPRTPAKPAAKLAVTASSTKKPGKTATTGSSKNLAEKASTGKSATGKASGSKAPAKSITVGTPTAITAEQRHKMICEEAYYRAERRGFSGGDPEADWVDAEVEIDRMLSGKR
jgi:hypothetical protein